MSELKIVLCECDVLWESPQENCRRIEEKVQTFIQSNIGDRGDILILPEFFSMGFTMSKDSVRSEGGCTLEWMTKCAKEWNMAIVGSVPVIVSDGETMVNRCYFVYPDGELEFYDKRHLFRMGEENEFYTSGRSKRIVEFKGWKIALSVCYDLRFPVWSRNRGLEYDLMINVASWPAVRIGVTEHLAKARAIENLSYFAFCNRCGEDPKIRYCGGSMIISPKGDDIADCQDIDGWKFYGASLSLSWLNTFREKFPVWRDADQFELN